jgi:hypothetical protein
VVTRAIYIEPDDSVEVFDDTGSLSPSLSPSHSGGGDGTDTEEGEHLMKPIKFQQTPLQKALSARCMTHPRTDNKNLVNNYAEHQALAELGVKDYMNAVDTDPTFKFHRLYSLLGIHGKLQLLLDRLKIFCDTYADVPRFLACALHALYCRHPSCPLQHQLRLPAVEETRAGESQNFVSYLHCLLLHVLLFNN